MTERSASQASTITVIIIKAVRAVSAHSSREEVWPASEAVYAGILRSNCRQANIRTILSTSIPLSCSIVRELPKLSTDQPVLKLPSSTPTSARVLARKKSHAKHTSVKVKKHLPTRPIPVEWMFVRAPGRLLQSIPANR